MWLRFKSDRPFAIKIFVVGINAVSGESPIETPETLMRRQRLLAQERNIQDYIVSPEQLWLDGVAHADGTVRQFVAMPLGSGYSVEAQLTGADRVGGMQIEVTPSIYGVPRTFPMPPGTVWFPIRVRGTDGQEFRPSVTALHTGKQIMAMISDVEGIPTSKFRVLFEGECLNNDVTLGELEVGENDMLEWLGEMLGGCYKPIDQISLAAGGLIKQAIIKDPHRAGLWDPEQGTIFNVLILNSAAFQKVTGKAPPSTPITADTYVKTGFPYYNIYDEAASGVDGDFGGLKSVNEMDRERKAFWGNLAAVAEVDKSTINPVVLLDGQGKRAGFRPLEVMEKEAREAGGTIGT